MKSSQENPYPLHPFLLALFPVLFLYAQNVRQTYVGNIIMPASIIVGLAVVLLFVLFLILRDYAKAGLVVSACLLFFFSYGHIAGALGEALSPAVLIVIWSVVLLLLIVFIIRLKADLRKFTRIVNYVAATLILIQGVQIGLGMMTGGGEVLTENGGLEIKGDTAKKPDIYFIVLDGYGREDVLTEKYNFDNSEFIGFLNKRGFVTADSSHSNYCQTLLSLTATLNMDYVHKLGVWDPQSDDRLPLYDKLAHNRLFDLLHKAGYDITAYSSGYSLSELRDVDNYISASWLPGEFGNMLIATTPLPVILNKYYSPFEIHHNRIEHILENLSDRKDNNKPEFVFAHLVCPHPPFVFGPDGQSIRPDRTFNMEDGSHFLNEGGTVAEYRAGYIDQVRFINVRMRKVINDLLDTDPKNRPVIILQADHGPGSELSWTGSSTTNIKERFSIFNAVYFPGLSPDVFYDEVSSVNTFRIVMNGLFGAGLEMLADSCYYTTWNRPYHFLPVVGKDARVYKYLLEYYLALDPGRVEYRHVSHPRPAGMPADSRQCIPIPDSGLRVDLDKVYHSTVMEISVDDNDDYEIVFGFGSKPVFRVLVPVLNDSCRGLRVELVKIPQEVSQYGFDNIVLFPKKGDGVYSLGHLRLGTAKNH